MTLRINVRLEPELTRKVKELRKRTGQSTTEIVKAALESYYVAVMRAGSPAVLLGDLVGCASGPSDPSGNYKRSLTKSLLGKTRA